MNQTVLITGSSTGIGKLTAKLFQQKGWNVIATMRSPEKETELSHLENVLVTKLDVKDPNTIESAVREGNEKFGAIDVLVNNAGYGGHGQLEQFSDETIRRMYATNVFGPINVMKAVLPDMRKRREGCIINITSGAGIFGIPNTAVYCSTKYALEGLTESMAYDLKPFGIKVKTVAPGGYGTNFSANTDDQFDQGDPELQEFAKRTAEHIYGKVLADLHAQTGATGDPQEVANIIYKCATEETPVRNVIGADVQMIVDMQKSMTRDEFIGRIEQMLIPQEV